MKKLLSVFFVLVVVMGKGGETMRVKVRSV